MSLAASTSEAKAVEHAKYVAPVDAVSAVVYENADQLFAYECFSQRDLLYGSLQRWNQLQGKFFQELQVRAGAGLAPLGFAHGGDGEESLTAIVAPGYSLPYFVAAFNGTEGAAADGARFLLNVGAVNYDESSGTVYNDYATPLDTVVAQLRDKFVVVTPTNLQEAEKITLLAVAVSKFATDFRGALNLFDAVSYTRNVVPRGQIDSVVSQSPHLLASLQKHLKCGAGSSFTQVLDKFNELTQFHLHNFQYTGPEHPETVFVTLGAVQSELFANQCGGDVGNIAVRIPTPFDADKFVAILPTSVQNLVLINQGNGASHGNYLKNQINAALFYSQRGSQSKKTNVTDYVYEPDFVWSPSAAAQIVNTFAKTTRADTTANPANKQFIYWGRDKGDNVDVPARIAKSMSLDDGKYVNFKTKYDNITAAGLFQAQLQYGPDPQGFTTSNVDVASVAIVEDVALLKEVNVAATVQTGGDVILVARKPLAEQDLSKLDTFVKHENIPEQFLAELTAREINLTLIDSEEFFGEQPFGVSVLIQAAFWARSFGYNTDEIIKRVYVASNGQLETADLNKFLNEDSALKTNVVQIPFEKIPQAEPAAEPSKDNPEGEKQKEEEQPELPIFPRETSFGPNNTQNVTVPESQTSTVQEISKRLAFKEAYGITKKLRPDLPVKNYVVKVKTNKRVTPADYDRYIFNIEFDISGTGMQYGLGEALGIHARNNEQQVSEFLENYGLDPNAIVQVPNKDNHNVLESRTVFQSFVENLDLFGKPPKRFYESLVELATDADDKAKLEALVAPEGAIELKKFQDIEFYNYVDILNLYPSARPSLQQLVTLIAPLKRREYSIASSQKMHPNEVHLLIVVVDWFDNQGRKRFGQASKYISDLQPGQELVVSVKPSVMKLPPNPEQPVVMSGLGTGLAPFKAIVEEKLWQKQQGQTIGEVYLYLGSRHKREEYLYGELWEAYKDAGIITHIGAAFSRDQPQKIYIQDRIRETLPELRTAIMDKQGSFYLCGPTWPVPDITQALKDIISADAQEKGIKIDLNAMIEEFKDTSRYILEVY
ncbi:sulfite reductase subunit alpha KNAG_0L01150 [Huiozyma naganishii CBS 8797]|uniref:assimilatory sulfite reductase (NADPH) n=1 Tax=Huiozyma naganishii (strain ATCC MYA-139 / BCRC 22969 / CBS 8797 / KCTC 17520 / NBRC 10181 / NCYC 3082 / Yp74L-3) TaxID=1071383 RepID=J7RCX8_HUIN7|nr:hypothetical protein KNAG_0L01150 [Kazachstania naganishii CBS 8797]CCK72735.1 hypothetical protein KNAG_0L01150 [Kazachstania naganishii CBS 8797]